MKHATWQSHLCLWWRQRCCMDKSGFLHSRLCFPFGDSFMVKYTYWRRKFVLFISLRKQRLHPSAFSGRGQRYFCHHTVEDTNNEEPRKKYFFNFVFENKRTLLKMGKRPSQENSFVRQKSLQNILQNIFVKAFLQNFFAKHYANHFAKHFCKTFSAKHFAKLFAKHFCKTFMWRLSCKTFLQNIMPNIFAKLFLQNIFAKHFLQNFFCKTFSAKHFLQNIFCKTFSAKHFLQNLLQKISLNSWRRYPRYYSRI